jgi:aspartyl-tRNA(Asn)/glutamyl-tRNA(Gln) amidotransferase subunit A
LTPDLALIRAQKADQELRSLKSSGNQKGSLPLGVPMAIKDVLCLEGVRTTCGSRILEDFIPPYSATVVERLFENGMVPLGKTNTDEFAMGSSTENSAYGPTRNPWNTGHVPGGSSGGSAAAVAAGFAPAALGTDTGGSVRQPAAYCGVTGIKPTYGRVSRYGLVAYGSSLDSVGVFARSAEDAALVLNVIAGYDRHDATSRDFPVPDYLPRSDFHLKGSRIGVPGEYFITGMQAEVERSVRDAILQFESYGAEIVPIQLPHTEYALPVYYLIAPAEASANLARYDGIRFGPRSEAENVIDIYRKTRGERFGAEVKRRIMLGTYALSAGYYDAYYGQAQRARTLIRNDFEKAFEKVDMIAAPVTPSTAFRFGEHSEDPLAMYLEDVFTLPANLAGIPGIAFPVGFDDLGLPIGMQLMGRSFDEGLLIQTAHTYQCATDWHLKRPELAAA